MKRVFQAVCDFFFPPRCAVCGELLAHKNGNRAMCHLCYEKYRTEIQAGCAVCGRAYVNCICRPRMFLPDDLVFALPYNKMDGICRQLVLACKNRKNANALAELADAAVSAAQKRGILTENALVTFVPRSPEKKIRTGVDQAEELAKAVAKRTGLPFYSLLARQNTGTEQKMLNPSRRKENADNAYSLLPYPLKRIQGATILLLDDVVTTGATVNACTVLLKEAGAARVICLAAAKSIKSYRESMRHPH